ncbi:DUF6193 family natural product biosynthesis protein [Micromonospora arborensis]|uniref:DUF6193 family natural product biosynthesis protein n=1 Tax=Micromonospora arborensis TaxID=2116518 RepID=UPI0037112497
MTDSPGGPGSDLYPDLVLAGGLVPALQQTARRQQVDQELQWGDDRGGDGWSASVSSNHGGIAVSVVVDRRAFSVTITVRGTTWAAGVTSDLAEVARVADAWHGGVTLRELHKEFPFMTYDRMAEAHEGGDPLAVQWELLLNDEDLAVIRPLLEAAHAHPRLRQMSPSVSHRTVLFLESNPEDRSAPMIKILRTGDGLFQLEGTGVRESQQAIPLEDVLVRAASALP